VVGEVVSVPSLAEQVVRGEAFHREAATLASPLAVHRGARVPRGGNLESGH